MTPQELEQKQILGERILDAFAVGALGAQLNIPGSIDLQSTAADLWTSAIGTVPESAGWVSPYESGSQAKTGIRIWNWLTTKTVPAAKAAKATLGKNLKLIATTAILAAPAYGAYVWLSESDRQNARKMDAEKDLILAAAQIKDPKLQAQALDAIGNVGKVPLGTLPWLAIIGGIAVVGIFFYTRKK